MADIPCPYCTRKFTNHSDLLQHMMAKRRVSAAHGLDADGRRRTRMKVANAALMAARVAQSMDGASVEQIDAA